MTMWSKTFWKDLAERGLKTFAQVLVATLTAAGTGLLDTDWGSALAVAGMAAVLSVVTSLASNVLNPDGTASLVTVQSAHSSR